MTAHESGGDGGRVAVVPANQASWQDLQAVLGVRGEPSRCQCQWFRSTAAEMRQLTPQERASRLHDQTGCGDPDATTSGLVAYVDGEPAGWCAVEPRSAYPRLRTSRVVYSGRAEDPDDPAVWAVTCFVTRVGFRRRGVSRALAQAAVDHARAHGARAVEGYPLVLGPGEVATWGELYVGSPSVFAAAGFTEVSHPTNRRLVMRREL